MKKKGLSSVGEFGFIERIRKNAPVSASVKLGIGDDAAVLTGTKQLQLFTTDMLVEDSHFRLKEATGFEIGRKALAVNISDIAAMGGLPTHAVAAVGFPAKLPLSLPSGLKIHTLALVGSQT